MNADTLLITALLAKGDAVSRQAAQRLRELTASAPDVHIIGKLTIYGGWRDPEVDGIVIKMPLLQLRYLQALARRPGYWVNKNELIEAMWRCSDEPEDPESGVEVYTSKVRRRLGDALGFNPIEMSRGLGYRLNIEALLRKAAA